MNAQTTASVQPALGSGDHVKGAIAAAQLDKVIPPFLSSIPGLQAIVTDIVTHATAISEAVPALGAAINVETVGTAVEAKKLTTNPIDDAAVKAAMTKLDSALAVGPLIDKVEHLMTDPASQKALQAIAKEKGLIGGVADARGGLQSINPSTVAVAGQVRDLIAKIQSHEALAHSAEAKASLAAVSSHLTATLDTLNKNILRLVTVFDKGIGATFS